MNNLQSKSKRVLQIFSLPMTKYVVVVGLSCTIQIRSGTTFPASATGGSSPLYVASQVKPGQPWVMNPTFVVKNLKGYHAKMDVPCSAYGGLLAQRTTATGYFYAKKVRGRWWLVDPQGCLFINKGVTAVAPGASPASQEALIANFGTRQKWTTYTERLLKQHGFNGTGAWSDPSLIQPSPNRLPYTLIWDFMGAYGRKRGGTYQATGHLGYPNDCIFVFDPQFESFCIKYAQKLSATKNDPYLLGHFSDNELPLPEDALDRYLALPQSDPGYVAAKAWLRQRQTSAVTGMTITDADRKAFLSFMTARYFKIVTRAIKQYDPHHLFLGSRLYGNELTNPTVIKSMSNFVDVLSMNYYNAWTPDARLMANWEDWGSKPFLITEWYVKGADAGLDNTSGAGWIVKTQKDRGLFYQNFALGLLQSKACVGWQWFKYMDNDPQDTTTDPSNRDANKGIVNNRYEEYKPLLEATQELNNQVYSLVAYFDTVDVNRNHVPQSDHSALDVAPP